VILLLIQFSVIVFLVTENVIRSVYQCAFHEYPIKIKVFGISLQTVIQKLKFKLLSKYASK